MRVHEGVRVGRRRRSNLCRWLSSHGVRWHGWYAKLSSHGTGWSSWTARLSSNGVWWSICLVWLCSHGVGWSDWFAWLSSRSVGWFRWFSRLSWWSSRGIRWSSHSVWFKIGIGQKSGVGRKTVPVERVAKVVVARRWRHVTHIGHHEHCVVLVRHSRSMDGV